MSDYRVDKEYNLLVETPQLSKAVFDQGICNCCWAICVATVMGYLYYQETENPKFEVSPQDILDRVWLYYNEAVRHKRRDGANCYRCNTDIAYTYVENHGVGFLDDYPFMKELNRNKDAIDPKTEFPRVFTGGYMEYKNIQGVIDSLKIDHQAVIGVIHITPEFLNYKKEHGIYKHPTTAGDHATTSSADPAASTTYEDLDKFGKHGVVIVGVNEEEGYFIIRNSWGTKWGDNGYGRVAYSAFTGIFSKPTSAFLRAYPLH